MRGIPGLEEVPAGDHNYNVANYQIIKESLKKGHIPLWSPYTLSGTPFHAKPQVPVFYISTLFMLIAPTPWAGFKWCFIFHLFLAGLNMYLLMVFGLKRSLKIGLISAIAYMFSNYIIYELNVGHPNILYPYAWFPLIFLFAIKAFESREWIKYAVGIGIVFSLQLLSGGSQIFFGSAIMFGCFLILMVPGKNFKKKIIKALLIGIIVAIIFFGITAIKVLPTKELVKIGARNKPFSFDYTFGHKTPQDMFKTLVLGTYGIGIASFILVLMSLAYYKKKKALLFWGLLIFSLLVLSGTFISYAVWKYIPFINKLRSLGGEKWITIFIFPSAVLVGLGAEFIINYINKKITLLKKISIIIPTLIISLLLFDLIVLGRGTYPLGNIKEELQKNAVLQYISKDEDIFRFNMHETKGIDWSTEHYTVPLGLYDVFGIDQMWLIDYLPIYLSVANQKPAKLYGVLNMKYLTSMNPLNISGFELVQKFEECGTYPNGIDICQPDKSDGPYLYKNKLFLPRAYIVNNSILIVGEDDPTKQVMYALMLDESYDPSTTAIIKGKNKIKDYNLESLKRFNTIILTPGSIDQNSVSLLNLYKKDGGRLIPDVTKGEASINKEEIEDALKSDKIFIPKDKELSYPSVNKAIINLEEGYNGFLVLSEKFSMFLPDWTAKINGQQKEILRANGVISAVYLEGETGNIVFEYKPGSFIIGAWISSVTLILITAYFIFVFVRKRKDTQ